MGHQPSSGQPYVDPGNGTEFMPKGEPENLSDRGAADAGGGAEPDAALREFAPLGKKRRLGTVKNDGEKVTIPKDTQKSSYNYPPSG